MLTPGAARGLFDRFAVGLVDLADLTEPVVLVDATSSSDPLVIEVPPLFPAVVVAVSAHGAPDVGDGSADVALTTALGAPAPWVTVADPEEAVACINARVAAAPGAAVALVELLRGAHRRSVEEGLLLESLAYSMLQGGPAFSAWRASRPARRARSEPGPVVLVRRHGDVMELLLNRPEVHNAYSGRMRDELCEALAVAEVDPGCRVVIRGAGPSFCSGGDLDEFGTFPDPVSAHLVRTGRSPARLISALSARTTAVLHGSCAGSGIELPAFAGEVVARPGAVMWLPELAMGLIPGAGGTVSLPRRIGAGRTAWLGLSGQPVDAPTALRWGLVDVVSGESD